MNPGSDERDSEPWNLLITAQEGAARDLRRFVRRRGAFRRSEFRNVLLGQVDDPLQFFQILAQDFEEKPFARAWLGKVLPIRVTFRVRPESFVQDVEPHLPALLNDLRGKSFHVRVERRGHKGLLHTHELERQLGDYLWERLQELQAEPRVSFESPDIVIAVEIVGDCGGIGLVSRQLCEEFDFVKID